MYSALRSKFEQHLDLKMELISTGSSVLVEHTENDAFWGDGGNGKGKNYLGNLLMKVRKELKQRQKME